jgi:hypothetical protein
MKKLIYVILLALALGLVPTGQAADAPKENQPQTIQSGSSSGTPTQSEKKHKKKKHHHKKSKEIEQSKT